MTRQEFEQLVAEAITLIPARFRKEMKNLAVVVEDEPGPEPRFCTREYRPVCAVDRGRFRTFGNSCEAEVAGWRIIDDGPC